MGNYLLDVLISWALIGLNIKYYETAYPDRLKDVDFRNFLYGLSIVVTFLNPKLIHLILPPVSIARIIKLGLMRISFRTKYAVVWDDGIFEAISKTLHIIGDKVSKFLEGSDTND